MQAFRPFPVHVYIIDAGFGELKQKCCAEYYGSLFRRSKVRILIRTLVQNCVRRIKNAGFVIS